MGNIVAKIELKDIEPGGLTTQEIAVPMMRVTWYVDRAMCVIVCSQNGSARLDDFGADAV